MSKRRAPNAACSVCLKPDNGTDDRQVLPYGEGNALICYDCMMARPDGAAEYERKFIAAVQKLEDADDKRTARKATRRRT